jgi:pimeloyl-ACP methyl ester carboxylesterase
VPGGVVEHLTRGTGQPVTLHLHGLGGAIDDSRLLAAGVAGTHVFARLPGYGRTRAEVHWPALFGAFAARVGASRAIGTSLGATTLLRLLAANPQSLRRVVLFLPAPPDGGVRQRAYDSLAALLRHGDPARLAAGLLALQPEKVRAEPAAQHWAARRALGLLADADPDVPLVLGPPADPRRLSAVDVPVLVIGQRGDPAHPVSAAEQFAADLPNATLRVFDAGGALWGNRAELREVISDFLTVV